ncbi:hypothetical protein, partial [Enterobacter hormaechei]|uniref:hypothetical protein n=1 Tax=Enterobacter hormaechei TaxID=158836 RepID=UPI0023E252A6
LIFRQNTLYQFRVKGRFLGNDRFCEPLSTICTSQHFSVFICCKPGYKLYKNTVKGRNHGTGKGY